MSGRMKEVLSDLAHVIGEETLAHMTAPYAKPFAPGGVPPSKEPPVDETEDIEDKSVLPGPEDEKGGDPALYGKEAKVRELDRPIRTEQDQVKVPPPPVVDDPKGRSVVGKTPKGEPEGDPELYKPERPVKELDDPVKDKLTGKGADLERKGRDILYTGKLKEQEEPLPPPPSRKREWKIRVGSPELDAVAAKAAEALRGKAENVRFRANVRFDADEAGKDAALEALKNVGLDVRDVEED